MKDTSRVLALSLYIPNCDKKGFFKRRQVRTRLSLHLLAGFSATDLAVCWQCKPSRGRRRGICWCVDRFGVKIPGFNYAGGDLQCKEHESSSNSNEWEQWVVPVPGVIFFKPIKLAHFMTANQKNSVIASLYLCVVRCDGLCRLSLFLRELISFYWVKLCTYTSYLPTICVACLRSANLASLYP